MVLSSSRGFVLPLVVTLLLALTLLFTTLLKSAGQLNPVLARYKSDFVEFYNAESAVLLHLQRFPSSYYPELPEVQSESFGPWEKICTVGVPDSSGNKGTAAEICFFAGIEPHGVSSWDWSSGMSSYKADLEKRILESVSEKSLYGNRRYFQGEESMLGSVHQGDLEMSFSDSVRSACFWVEGSVLLRGQAHFDTLRLYALGEVTIQDEVSVDYLELYSQGSLLAEGDVRFSGMVLASSFRIRDRVQGIFPTAVVAFGQVLFGINVPWGEVIGKAVVEGTVETPGGFLNVEDSAIIRRTMLPAFVEGRRKIWGRL